MQRFLVALLKDNPAIDLDDMQLNAIIDQVSRCYSLLAWQCVPQPAPPPIQLLHVVRWHDWCRLPTMACTA